MDSLFAESHSRDSVQPPLIAGRTLTIPMKQILSLDFCWRNSILVQGDFDNSRTAVGGCEQVKMVREMIANIVLSIPSGAELGLANELCRQAVLDTKYSVWIFSLNFCRLVAPVFVEHLNRHWRGFAILQTLLNLIDKNDGNSFLFTGGQPIE